MSARLSWPARAWLLLTAVPGRPAAAWPARGRRALPLLLPAMALLALAGWKCGMEDPQMRAARGASQPLLNLEREVAGLRAHPASGAAAAAERARDLRATLPRGSAGLPAVLRHWQAQAAAHGWEAAFGPTVGSLPDSGVPLVFVSVRASLQPLSGNRHSWSSLVGLLGALSAQESRIEVTRLAIRADEQGRYSVETRLSTPYLAEIQDYPQ
jgi:hypothetical protein